ncbi:TolB family protein [Lysobacter enzymogenes]|uniref:WD40 domain-containing protein n=3 Tax=Bacteria TaxID=2 RepID=A0AAU9ADI9_LYSEN|nr:PD40 domain-containing protein [Lysobacter enzymogenes]BAV96302.1 WD40 domain-containing protein [Lysobacter enzymogenes]
MFATPLAISALALALSAEGIGIEPPIQPVQLISHVHGKSEPVWDAFNAQISADGNTIVFTSAADDLIDGADTNGHRDVFLYDLGCERMVRISDSVAGAEGNADSSSGSVSGDGRYVAFSSHASNLVPGDGNAEGDVFLLDRDTGQLRRISAAPNTIPRPRKEGSYAPRISADGRFVAFTSNTDTLVSGDDNRTNDVYLYEIASGRIELGSRAADGGFADSNSGHAEISADGRRLLFTSMASDLLGAPSDRGHLYLRDRLTGITEMVDRAPNGQPSDGDRSDMMYALSGDGRYAAFTSRSARLWPGTWSARVLFLRDTQLGTLRPITAAPGDAMNNWYSATPALSYDGLWLAYMSGNASLDLSMRHRSLFLRKLEGDTLALTPTDGNTLEGTSWFPSLSADGNRVVFESNSRDLIPGVSDGGRAIYLFDYGGGGSAKCVPRAGGR